MSVQKKLKSLSIHCQSYEDREFVLQFFQLEEMEGKRKFTYAYEKKPWFFKKSGDFDVHIEALRWDRESDLASGIAKMLAHPDSAVLNRVQFSRFTYAFFGEFLENYPTAKVDVQYEYHVTWQLSETEELESLFRLKQAKFWVAEFTLSKEIFSIHTLVNLTLIQI